MKKHTATIELNLAEANRIENILTHEPRCADEAYDDSICYHATFDNGYRAYVYIVGVNFSEKAGANNLPYVEVEIVDNDDYISAYFNIANSNFFGIHSTLFNDETYELVINKDKSIDCLASVQCIINPAKDYSCDEDEFIRRIYDRMVNCRTAIFYSGGFSGLYDKVKGGDKNPWPQTMNELIDKLRNRGVLVYENEDDFYFAFL